MRTRKTHRQYQHTQSSSSYPPPLWNGSFCTLGCKTQSAHEAVANITLCVGPAFHGETIPLGGYPRTGKTWNWNIYGPGTHCIPLMYIHPGPRPLSSPQPRKRTLFWLRPSTASGDAPPTRAHACFACNDRASIYEESESPLKSLFITGATLREALLLCDVLLQKAFDGAMPPRSGQRHRPFPLRCDHFAFLIRRILLQLRPILLVQ